VYLSKLGTDFFKSSAQLATQMPCFAIVIRADDKICSVLSAITTLKSLLAEMIEPDFGLLDRLLATKVLTRRQISKVHSERTVYDRNDTLLDLLTGEDQCNEFVRALQRTNQPHVVNFIRQNGG